MSRNYVDVNGNLIQIAGKGIGVAEWGEPIAGWLKGHTTSATARVADKDGVVYISQIYENARVYIFVNNVEFTGTKSNGASAESAMVLPIRKGDKVYTPSTGGTVKSVFFPFKENNNLQMVREKYSTEETVIGEWIDGKPIYRKVIANDMATKLTFPIAIDLSIKQIIHSSFIGSDNDSNTSAHWTSESVNNESGNNGNIYFNANYTSIERNGSYAVFAVIIEYTKTTD